MVHKTRILPDLVGNMTTTGLILSDEGEIMAARHVWPTNLVGFQETFSDGHQFYRLGKSGGADIGGTFQSAIAEWKNQPSMVDVRAPGYWGYYYKGLCHAFTWDKTLASGDFITPFSGARMASLGTTGVARNLPTNPLSGMGQFFGELHELPTITVIQEWKRKAQYFNTLRKKVGSEYLNYAFGWAPFIKDIQSFARVTKRLTKEAQQYDRNSGRHIRRQGKVFTSKDTSVQELGAWYGNPSIPTTCVLQAGKLSKSYQYSIDVTFSGAFTYYLPVPDNFVNSCRYYEAQANHLYGARLTPELLWQLAPWSWAVDWVTNAGDVIHNLSAFATDGLVMHYGYVMAHQVRTETYSGTGLVLTNGQTVAASQTISAETRQRMAATPYGFGLDLGEFSPRQLAIMAALGLTKR